MAQKYINDLERLIATNSREGKDVRYTWLGREEGQEPEQIKTRGARTNKRVVRREKTMHMKTLKQ